MVVERKIMSAKDAMSQGRAGIVVFNVIAIHAGGKGI
jgi:hypothetical protein